MTHPLVRTKYVERAGKITRVFLFGPRKTSDETVGERKNRFGPAGTKTVYAKIARAELSARVFFTEASGTTAHACCSSTEVPALWMNEPIV